MHQNHFWLREKVDGTLSSFYDPHDEIIPAIKQWQKQQSHFHLHINGYSHTGKTHLIYGLINEFHGKDILLINKATQTSYAVDELLTRTILIIDDLTSIIDHRFSTEQFIELYNHRLNKTLPLITASCPIDPASYKADLVSRINAATPVHTNDQYSPSELIHLHQLIANRHGYHIEQTVAQKLVTFYERRISIQLPILFNFLEYLQVMKKNPSISSFSTFQKTLD